jgi:hypothetical protein
MVLPATEETEMTVGQISPDSMFDVIKDIEERSDWDSGQLGAICHVAMLTRREITLEEVSDFQDDLVTGSPFHTADYVDGYTEAWKALYGMLL